MYNEINIFVQIAVFVLTVANCMLAYNDMRRSYFRTIVAPFIILYCSVNAYGILLFPGMELKPAHEMKFSYQILGNMYSGLLCANLALLSVQLGKMLMLTGVNRAELTLTEFRMPRPRVMLMRLLIAATVCYACIYIFMYRDRLPVLLRVLAAGDFGYYYEIRLEQIYQRAATHPIINNLNAILVQSMLVFLLGYFFYDCYKRRRFRLSHYFLLGLALLVGLIRFQKAPILVVLLVLSLSFVYARFLSLRGGAKIFKIVAVVGVFVILCGAVFSVLGYEGNIVKAVHDRILISPIFTSYGFYYTFPEHHGFLHYGGSRTLNLLLGFGQDVEFTTIATTAPLIAGEFFYGTMFNMNTSVLGAGYSQGGYFGVFQEAFILFGVFAFWDVVFLRVFKNVPYEPVLVYFFANFMVILNNGVLSIMSTGFLVVPILYLTVMSKRRSIR